MIKNILFSSLLVVSLLLAGGVFFSTQPVLAQSSAQLACEGAGGTFADGECTSTDSDGACLIGDGCILNGVVNTLLVLIGAVAVIMIIVGGIRYVISAGDQNAVTAAKNTILYAVIGLIVAILAYALVQFIIGAVTA